MHTPHLLYFHKNEKARYSYKKTKRLERRHSLTRMDFICIYYIIDIATLTTRTQDSWYMSHGLK